MSFLTQELNRKTINIQNVFGFVGQNSQYKLEGIMPKYSSDLVTAYYVQQTKGHSILEVYAISPKLAQVMNFARFQSFLVLGNMPFLTQIVDYGITKTSDSELFTVLLEYLAPEKLIRNHLHLFVNKPEILLQKVIIPLLETLVQMHHNGIVHGCINLDNVWINTRFDTNYEIDKIILSNTALDICGYNQNNLFEPVPRMLVHRAGKSPNALSADCYAVGMLLLICLSGKLPSKKSYETLLISKAKHTSYKTMISELFNDDDSQLDKSVKYVAYWLLHDDEDKRWSASQALKFLRRRHRKLTLQNVSKAISQDLQQEKKVKTPFTFINEECYSMTEAAVFSVHFYEDIKLKVKNGKLVKALLKNDSISSNFISKVSELRQSVYCTNNFTSEEMFLTLFITLLNKNMPIKLKEICVEPDAIWQLAQYLMHQPFSSAFNNLQKAIHSNTIAFILNIMSKVSGIKTHFQCDLKRYRTMLGNFSKDAITSFAVSSMIPQMVTIDFGQINFTNTDILESIQTQDDLKSILEDEKLLCVMLSRVIQQSSIDYTENPVLQNDILNRGLFVFACCQSIYQKPLKSIANYFHDELIETHLKRIRYLPLRKRIANELQIAVNSGDIVKMYRILQDKRITQKNEMFIRVKKRVHRLHSRITENDRHSKNVQYINAIGRIGAIKTAGTILLMTLIFICYHLFWI